MGSDTARISYDPAQYYRSVVMQQGRVTLEADWNEDQSIFGEELRHETLDIVGAAGSPDGGYAVIQTNNAPQPPFDFTVSAGTAYVGGLRLTLHEAVQYSKQNDWLDYSSDPDWMIPSGDGNGLDEYVYLLVREQEISAVEDSALRDVALGGPDTAQRTRMIQHIVRLSTGSADCTSGLSAAQTYWGGEGLDFDPATMRLKSQSTLLASFQNVPAANPCEPEVAGGYLGADNQLIRVQMSGKNTLVWGFDDASFLYRVTLDATGMTVTLQSQPVDAFHQPQANQAVEVLRCAAELANKEYVASAVGNVQTLATSYNPYTMQIELPNAVPAAYLDANQTPQVFLRVWQQQLTFTPGTPIELGTTGLFVTLNTAGGEPFHLGDYWQVAVRPTTPTQLYPQRYLDAPQHPDGPRLWACPLAAIEWNNGVLTVEDVCLPPFDNLVDLTKRKGTGCCTVSVSPGDLSATKTLQTILDSFANRGPVKICLGPGEYDLAVPLALGSQHSNFTIEACPGAATLQAAKGAEGAFTQGLVTLSAASSVTLRGLTLDLPLSPFTLGTGKSATQIYYSIGLRPVDSPQFSVEGCTFAYSAVAPSDATPVVAVGILAGGDCVGLKLKGNGFMGAANRDGVPIGLQLGFGLFPTSSLAESAATFLSAWLDTASVCDNMFDSLAFPILVYADCGLVTVTSNAVRNCMDGFMFISLPALGYVDEMANVEVAPANVPSAVKLHNAIYSALASPMFQSASGALRGFPVPQNYTPPKAVKFTVNPKPATDISGIQRLYDETLPALNVKLAPAGTAAGVTKTSRASKTVALVNEAGLLTVHPVAAIQPVPTNVITLNQTFSLIEKQALTNLETRDVPVALHLAGNDVQMLLSGAFVGLGVFVLSGGTNSLDTVNLADNSFAGGTTLDYMPVGFILGATQCAVTGNVILNEGGPIPTLLSLFVLTRAIASADGGAPVYASSITGNVLRGLPFLPPRNLTPMPVAPMDAWDFFNSVT
jgi:hypothetical protein